MSDQLLITFTGEMLTGWRPLFSRGKPQLRASSSFNSFQRVVDQNERYCAIRDQLSLTHRLVWGEPYAWERWDRLE